MSLENFITAESGSMSEEQLMKSLSAGYGTDSQTYSGGRVLIPEDIEITMMNAMREQKEDCKLLNTLKKQPVKSTVHEYNRRTDVGDYEFLTTSEGGESENNDQQLERVTRQIKYLQDRRSVTDQMEIAQGFENAYQSEKMAGTLNILKAAEYLSFHGDSSVIPTEFDGLIRQIENSKNPNVVNLKGKTIANFGEKIFTEPAYQIYNAGGDANKLFFPPVLAEDIQSLIRDRIRFGTDGSGSASLVVDKYPTPYGSTISFGLNEGADKFFKVKSIVQKKGNSVKAPQAPEEVSASFEDDSKSRFTSADEGEYKYTVHSINRYGISEGKEVTSAVVVQAGKKVVLTIKDKPTNLATGYIICRSAKNGDVVMEMVRIGRTDNETRFEDLNEDLPGTAQMLFLTEKKLQTVIQWFQLAPLRVRPLYESNKAETPFFVQLFGTVDAKVPEWCCVVKNIAYQGGLKF